MDRKLLLAVDDSIHSKYAVEYAVRMASVVKGLTYSLLHVQPPISQYILDEAEVDFKARAELNKIIRKNAESARSILEKYKAQMIRMGIAEEYIDVITHSRVLGLAKDILDCAEQGLYDAVVVGRRGLSRTQKLFVGSVAAKLMEHSRVIPVWVVDGDVTSMRIMMAVDGSETSFRAVDHLSFMVAGSPEVKVTLFHVIPKIGNYCMVNFDEKEEDVEHAVAQGDRRCMDHFYVHVRQKFKEVGMQEDQVEIKVIKRAMNVGKAVFEEAEKGGYGTVVVGRRGVSKAFFMGSVSKYVVDRTSNRAVWIVS